jgi:hypothetical protein
MINAPYKLEIPNIVPYKGLVLDEEEDDTEEQ